MENKTKGIIGAVGALAIGAGAYFGFSGGDAEDYSTSEVVRPTALEKQFDSLLENYNKTGVMPDTDDDNIVFETENDFNVWSWQKYLFLTQDVGDSNVYKPLFLKKMYQVGDDGQPLTTTKMQNYLSNGFKYLDNVLDTNQQLTLKLNQQAYKKNKIFSGSKAKEENLVFYSVHINETLKKDLDDYSNLIIEDTTKNSDIYSNGALELKIAWAKVSSLHPSIANKTIKLKAKILDRNGDDSLQNVEMALIGIHIVGVTKGQPGFIWSTFEHDMLAYNYEKQDGDDYVVKKPQPTILQFSDEHSDYIRKTPYGVVNNDDYKAEIIAINSAVKKVEIQHNQKKYFLNGSVWLKPYYDENNKLILDNKILAKKIILENPADFATEKLAAGSLLCANVAMETNFQESNCFTCHNTNVARNHSDKNKGMSTLYFSHLYVNKGKSKDLIISHLKKSNLINDKILNDVGIPEEVIKMIPEKVFADIYSQIKKENSEYFESLK